MSLSVTQNPTKVVYIQQLFFFCLLTIIALDFLVSMINCYWTIYWRELPKIVYEYQIINHNPAIVYIICHVKLDISGKTTPVGGVAYSG